MTNAEATSNETVNNAAQSAPVAPAKASTKKDASQKKGAPKGKKAEEPKTPFDGAAAATVKPAKPKKTPNAKKAQKTKAAVQGSNKKADVIAMMKRAKGATLPEIIEATGWAKHTIRGFVSLLASKEGTKVESTKSSIGERTYRIPK